MRARFILSATVMCWYISEKIELELIDRTLLTYCKNIVRCHFYSIDLNIREASCRTYIKMSQSKRRIAVKRRSHVRSNTVANIRQFHRGVRHWLPDWRLLWSYCEWCWVHACKSCWLLDYNSWLSTILNQIKMMSVMWTWLQSTAPSVLGE